MKRKPLGPVPTASVKRPLRMPSPSLVIAVAALFVARRTAAPTQPRTRSSRSLAAGDDCGPGLSVAESGLGVVGQPVFVSANGEALSADGHQIFFDLYVVRTPAAPRTAAVCSADRSS